jgi:uncharacterized protein YjbJ (UPF0337 family)
MVPANTGPRCCRRRFVKRLDREQLSDRHRRFVMAGTSKQVKGKANKVAGSAKKAVGKATKDRSLQAKGSVQKAKGSVQNAAGKVQRKVRGAGKS